MADRRPGLKPPFRAAALDALARAERNAALIMRGHLDFRRTYDPESVIRLVDRTTARVHDQMGMVIKVEGFFGGVADSGLTCNDCPLSDLIPVLANG